MCVAAEVRSGNPVSADSHRLHFTQYTAVGCKTLMYRCRPPLTTVKWVESSLFLPALCSRKASLKDKVFPSPSKAPVARGKVQSPGAEDGAEASPNKVTKSWSFNEKNRGPKQAFRARGSTSRQNSDGKTEQRKGNVFSVEHYRHGGSLMCFTHAN